MDDETKAMKTDRRQRRRRKLVVAEGAEGVFAQRRFEKMMNSEMVSRFGNLIGFMAPVQLITEA